MADTVVQELVINTLTQAQFDAAKEAGTLSPYELYGTPDTSVRLPVLTPMWFDHVANDISWLRADTFSWQSGDVYKAAYEHLSSEYKGLYIVASGEFLGEEKTYYRDSSEDTTPDITGKQYFAWVAAGGDIAYTTSTGPNVGDYTVNRTGTLTGEITESTSKSDTIDGITITYSLADDGHKICLPDQESNLVALYEATGVAWYYILDTTNKQFKLPRTKYGFTGLRDSVGGYVEPALPNIEGSFTQRRDNDVNTVSVSGAFSYSNTGAANSYYYGNNSTSNGQMISFDASESNSIYGNSDTVQPPATQMYLYFYVGNFEQSAIEQTAGLNTEMFNNLNAHKIIEFQAPNAANGYTWYRKYADGWVEQGGRLTMPATNAHSSSNVAITLPVPIKTPESAVLSYSGLNASENFANCENQASLSTTTATIGRWNNGSSTAAARSYMWVLYGQAQ